MAPTPKQTPGGQTPPARDLSETLMAIYRACRQRFGDLHWWPGEGALEICVGAILTQNTNWSNVEKAIARLQAAGAMNLPALGRLEPAELGELIRPAGYYNVKARRLKAFIAAVADWPGGLAAFLDRPAEALRADLLAVNGIGPETADSMILYAAERPVFVVDAYTLRIFRRHGLLESSAGYDEAQRLFEQNLPRDAGLWNDYHAQVVMVGKHHCKPTARCENCPLAGFPHDPNL